MKKFWQKQLPGVAENAAKPGAVVSPETARAVVQMNCLSQFSALRDLHGLHRTEGESPATLAAMVRAYAHLGQLTMLHWNASHCVYQVRSLLYAQRWVARDPTSALAMWHRAYALALAGLHRHAQRDLETAAQLAKSAGERESVTPPAWVPLIEGLCRYDIDGLYRKVKSAGPHIELAWLCTYLAAEPGGDADQQRLTIGFEALAAVPDCLRISASMAITNGIALKFRATAHGAKNAPLAWRKHLVAMKDLDPAVRQTADNITARAEEVRLGRGIHIARLPRRAARDRRLPCGRRTDRSEPSSTR